MFLISLCVGPQLFILEAIHPLWYLQQTEKWKRLNTYRAPMIHSNASALCTCMGGLCTSHSTVWGSSSSYPPIPQLTLLLSLPPFLVLIVSSREKERDHRGSVSSLAYSSLFCPQTGGHNTHTSFFIGLSHTYVRRRAHVSGIL